MPKEERDHLLQEIEEIRTTIENLQPAVFEQQMTLSSGSESSRARLTTLRKALARDMELLHAAG